MLDPNRSWPVFALALLVMAGCSASPALPLTPTAHPTARAAIPQTIGFRRVTLTCHEMTPGTLSGDWRRHAAVIGQVTFALSWSSVPASKVAAMAAVRPTPITARTVLTGKDLLVVDPGYEATLLVPQFERSWLSLQFAPGDFSPTRGYQLASGEQMATFVACPPGYVPLDSFPSTQFLGTMVVTGSRCAVVEVWQGPTSAGTPGPAQPGAGAPPYVGWNCD
jgi:hypothetical protein